MKKATVIGAFFPRRQSRRVKRKFRFCELCGAWTHGNVREHDTLCFAIDTNVRLLATGKCLAFVHPAGMSSAKHSDLPLARWPRRADAARAAREGYERRSTRSNFSSIAHYSDAPPDSKRSMFSENKLLIERLRQLGYSDGEITLALWSNYDQ